MIKKIKEKEKQKYKRIPVEKCGFSLRTYYALRSGIDDLYSLVCIYNSDEISSIKSIGRGCSKEIEGYFIENFPEMRTEGSIPVSEISNPKVVEKMIAEKSNYTELKRYKENANDKIKQEVSIGYYVNCSYICNCHRLRKGKH